MENKKYSAGIQCFDELRRMAIRLASLWGLVHTVLLMAGCQAEGPKPPTQGENDVYYWRTTFSLDSTERAFLTDHRIRRLYCRYFDVVMDGQRGPVPNATVSFEAEMPDSIEVVPTVFIMNNSLPKDAADSLASLIVRRVMQINESHDIRGVKELQIDYDYTARNRETYYLFLDKVRAEARRQGLKLSTTIRLHQLSMPAPPADYGVLMLYNTGKPERFTERNPILDMRDVTPYLRHLKGYPLPLAAAYPVFRWQRDIHGVAVSHEASFDVIMQTKRAVEAERPELRERILTYHLNHDNIKRYQSDQYEEIYRH